MLERLPFWGQVLLMVALSVGLVGIAYYLFPNLKEKGEAIQAINVELEDMNAKIVEGGRSSRSSPNSNRRSRIFRESSATSSRSSPRTPRQGICSGGSRT